MKSVMIIKSVCWPMLAVLVFGLWGCDKPKASTTPQSPAAAKPAPKAAAPEAVKGTLEVAGKQVAAPSDPVVDQYRRKLSMALF